MAKRTGWALRAGVTGFAAAALVSVACGSGGDDSVFGNGAGSPANGGNGGASGGGSLGGGNGSGADEACSPAGATRACCADGTQTCGGGEFPTWGPCLDKRGVVVTCPASPTDAGAGSVGQGGGSGHYLDASMPELCTDDNVNTEPEILVGYFPASGQTVGATGQIKVWVNDEHPPIIAPNEALDPSTGAVVTPGDRTAKAPDGYLWEPALYIAPDSAENGGTPHFPSRIVGWSDSTPGGGGKGVQIPGMDPVPAGAKLKEKFTGEDVWDVASLGLGPGTYIGEFVIHDGDDDRAIGCVTITIAP